MRIRSRTNTNSAGFTLLELLVSVSIIVVLASLLLPAIHSTRERTDRVQCLDNHRQMLLAWSLFANDHQGTLPANGYTPAGGSPADLRWVQGYLNPRVAADDLSNERLLTDASYAQLAPYLPRASIYHCPSDRGTERIRSYAMNAYVGWVGPVQRPLQAGHRIYRHWEDLDQPGPAKLMVFIDVRPESICWPFFGITMVSDAGGQFFAFPATHHADGAQVAFADGHVERKRWSDPRTLRPGNLLYHAHDTPSPGNSDLAWLRSVATVRH